MIFKRSTVLLCVALVALSLMLAGTAEAAKGGKPGKPPDDPPTPEPPANPEIVLNYNLKSGNYFGVINADGSNFTPITLEGGWPPDSRWGTWSPDGQHIAFEADMPQAPSELWRTDLDGTNVMWLADWFFDRPRWSPATDPLAPSFNRIAYEDGEDGDMLLVDADGGTPEIVLDSTWPEGNCYYCGASWSPDGSKLGALRRCFGSEPGEPDQIVAVTVGGPAEPEVLYESPSELSCQTLDWARQHDWLAFVTEMDGVRGVYVLDAELGPGGPVSLAVPGMTTPSWSPDDSQMLVITPESYKVEANISDSHMYVYEGFNESDFSGGNLTFINHGHWAEWKRCIAQEDGTCLIP